MGTNMKVEISELWTIFAHCEREKNRQTLDFGWLRCGYRLGKKKDKADNITLNHLPQHVQISLQAFQWTEFVHVYRELNQKED